MKKFILLSSVLFFFFFLFSCKDDDNNSTVISNEFTISEIQGYIGKTKAVVAANIKAKGFFEVESPAKDATYNIYTFLSKDSLSHVSIGEYNNVIFRVNVNRYAFRQKSISRYTKASDEGRIKFSSLTYLGNIDNTEYSSNSEFHAYYNAMKDSLSYCQENWSNANINVQIGFSILLFIVENDKFDTEFTLNYTDNNYCPPILKNH